MKALRTLVALLLALLFTYVKSQTDGARYVEVLVEDTIHLPILSITFVVSITEEEDEYQYHPDQTPPEKVTEEVRTRKLDGLAQLLTYSGFICARESTAEQLLGFGYDSIGPRSLDVTVGSIAELERLYAVVRSVPRGGFGMKNVTYVPPSTYAPALVKKLHAHALIEAGTLALAGARNLGELREVADLNEPAENSLLRRWMRTGDAEQWKEEWRELHGVSRRSMRFRFELVP